LLAFDDGDGPALYTGGRIGSADGTPARHLARWNGRNWFSLRTGTGSPVPDPICCVTSLEVADDGSGPELFVATDAVRVWRDAMLPELEILVQPELPHGTCVGERTTLSVTAGGDGPFSYQWRKNGADIPGATAETYTFVAPPDRTLSYDVVLHNGCLTTASEPVEIFLVSSGPPEIVVQPYSIPICVGQYISLYILIQNQFATYQWRKDSIPIPGATLSSYDLGNVSASTAGTYDVVVTNGCGSVTSDPAVLTFEGEFPSILVEPVFEDVCPGDTATFAAIVKGPALTSQAWYRIDPGTGDEMLVTAEAFFTITSVSAADAGDYVFRVTDECLEGAFDYPAYLNVLEECPAEPRIGFTHAYAPYDLYFEEVQSAGQSRTLEVVVKNFGLSPLRVESVALAPGSRPAFSVAWDGDLGGLVLEHGARTRVRVTFSPAAAGQHAGEVLIASDDPNKPVVHVAVHGAATAPAGDHRLLPGDCNTDGAVDLSDAICLLGFLFLGTPKSLPCGDGTALDPGNDSLLNWNADATIDVSDAIGLLGWLFLGGPPHSLAVPGDPEACVAIAGCPDSSDCTP